MSDNETTQKVSVDFDGVNRWISGDADSITAALIEDDLGKPESVVRDYLAWLSDAHTYMRSHDSPPALVTDWFAMLPAETVAKLERIADDLPPEASDEEGIVLHTQEEPEGTEDDRIKEIEVRSDSTEPLRPYQPVRSDYSYTTRRFNPSDVDLTLLWIVIVCIIIYLLSKFKL